ncbi:MAG: MmgE/PrpD family protein [Gammaproteobacteria bacterium]|nr:MmgE/PrpD family protein [Gammaproteobacteria bacterium]
MSSTTPHAPIATELGAWLESLDSTRLPRDVERACADTVIDTLGLSIAARNSDYVNALRESWTALGPCTVFGSDKRLDAASAAMINGTAAHGEDFDNTFEGCPVHWGAVVVPAVIAAAEAHRLSGSQTLIGLAVGGELMCRLGLLAQKGVHTAGFHPTAVLGAMGATAGVAAALRLTRDQTANALGIAGSMASGIIEYLADGSWTKRMHAGWAAQSGLRAASMARAGFTGPATVFEGTHGLLHGFAPSVTPDFETLRGGLGETWHVARTAFKPYACGTMTQPFIDCAKRLAERVEAAAIVSLHCRVGEGTVHRLWEPIALKRKPPNPYAAKFSTPYCIAVGFVRGNAGLAEFTDEAVRDAAVLDIANRVSFEIDPDDEYPRNYTGSISATLTDGSVVEEFQPYMRGGSRDPMSREELVAKCAANIAYGGVDARVADAVADFADSLGEASNSDTIDRALGKALAPA